MSTSSQVIVIGGGFAGVYTTKELLRMGFEVLLISETNYFTFTPLLHEVATGSLVSHDIVFEYESFFHHPAFRFIRGQVESIDRENRLIKFDGCEESYDYLVLAPGSVTNTFAIEGTQHAFVLKNVEDATRLKRALISQVQEADRDVSVNVIGAGPTGIELVFEIARLFQQIKRQESKTHWTLQLINGGPDVCGHIDADLQTYILQALKRAHIELVCNAQAQKITPTEIQTTQGNFPSDVTILCAGVRPNTQLFAGILSLDAKGHIPVNSFLQTKQDEHIFSLGDASAMDGSLIPKLAQIAVHQAKIVAKNIYASSRSLPLEEYHPRILGMLFSLGFGDGIGKIGPVVVKGFIAWYLWRTVYLFKTPGFGNKLRIAFSWTLGLFQGRNIIEL